METQHQRQLVYHSVLQARLDHKDLKDLLALKEQWDHKDRLDLKDKLAQWDLLDQLVLEA